MKRLTFIVPLLACFCVLACAPTYVKKINKELKIEHVFSRPTTAYGPGSVVMYEEKSGYTGVCNPEWIVGTEQPKINPIADIRISKDAKIDFNLKLDVQDRAKVGAEYQDISKATLTLTNGHQAEIITDLRKAFNNMGRGACGNNCRELGSAHPKAKFYFVRVAYGYDIDVKIQRKNGAMVSGEMPKEVLKVVSAKIGMQTESGKEESIIGKNLYLGFNGTPRTIPAEDMTKGALALDKITDPILDMTDWLK